LNDDKVRFTFNENGLHVVHINIQHLLPNLDEIYKCHLSNQSLIDIFGMVETFLHSDVDDNSLRIKHFKFERSDRLQKRGGGILVYIKNNIIYRRRYDLESKEIESIWLEIKFPNTNPF